jgi:hypothetical protein
MQIGLEQQIININRVPVFFTFVDATGMMKVSTVSGTGHEPQYCAARFEILGRNWIQFPVHVPKPETNGMANVDGCALWSPVIDRYTAASNSDDLSSAFAKRRIRLCNGNRKRERLLSTPLQACEGGERALVRIMR